MTSPRPVEGNHFRGMQYGYLWWIIDVEKEIYAASLYGCTGWIRNEWDGSVTVEIQDEPEAIDRVIQTIGAGRYVQIYKGANARAFAEEMTVSGTVDLIRAEAGNLRYEHFQSLDDPETILLIDSWTDQAVIDAHHASPMMATIAELREKYDLHMTVERSFWPYTSSMYGAI